MRRPFYDCCFNIFVIQLTEYLEIQRFGLQTAQSPR